MHGGVRLLRCMRINVYCLCCVSGVFEDAENSSIRCDARWLWHVWMSQAVRKWHGDAQDGPKNQSNAQRLVAHVLEANSHALKTPTATYLATHPLTASLVW